MRITCPHCGYSKDLPEDKIPAKAARVNCPRCNEKFALQTASTAPDNRASDDDQLIMSEAQEELAATAEHAVTIEEVQPRPATDVSFSASAPLNPISLPKAGFWIRAAALLLDTILVTVIQGAVGFGAGLFIMQTSGDLNDSTSLMLQVVGLAITTAYYVIFTGRCGQTPGKMTLRIKVIRRDGSEIGYARAAFREIFAKLLSALLLMIGYLMAAFDSQKQGLHDRLADTYVIRVPKD